MTNPFITKRNLQLCALAGSLLLFTLSLSWDAFAQGKGKAKPVSAVYAQNCARCHGADGKGTALGQSLETPDLTDADLQKKMSAAKIRKVILNGDGPMPAFKAKLKAAEVTALIGYVRAFKGK